MRLNRATAPAIVQQEVLLMEPIFRLPLRSEFSAHPSIEGLLNYGVSTYNFSLSHVHARAVHERKASMVLQ